ncbi:MAG TPA: hypothetical protein VJ901_10775 [Thermoanaerobaculia bacterium]|jgi:hypothetical protein|nr:hypothetical protein [Thermoanaerobaculia bacterium]
MNNAKFNSGSFRSLASAKFRFLEDKGFRREPKLETTSPTAATVVYLGRHVGFIFSLDLRDICVDAQVVKVENHRIMRNWEGGYSSELFMHLVTHAGLRGLRKAPGVRANDAHALEQMIDRWAQLLLDAGQTLLLDRPESLPR